MDPKFFYSESGRPLVYWVDRDFQRKQAGMHLAERPTLTVENYSKWYDIYLVHADGRVEKVLHAAILACESGAWHKPAGEELCDDEYYHLGEALNAWYDHIPNPKILERLAASLGAEWDEQSKEMILGRYRLEVCRDV